MTEASRADMQCLEFRRAVGAEPGLPSPAVLAHAAECPACAEYRRQMRSLDGLLHRALEIPVPAMETQLRPKPAGRRRQLPWLALAASMLLAAGLGFGLWTTAPRESLAATVVDHLSHEPEAMVISAERVAPFALDDVLAEGGIRLRGGLEGVSYARSCPIRGHAVPHLVVQTDSGPVTVLVMAREPVTREVLLHAAGHTGTIVPAGPGSIAIIGGGSAAVADVRNQVLEAVEFIAADQ